MVKSLSVWRIPFASGIFAFSTGYRQQDWDPWAGYVELVNPSWMGAGVSKTSEVILLKLFLNKTDVNGHQHLMLLPGSVCSGGWSRGSEGLEIN